MPWERQSDGSWEPSQEPADARGTWEPPERLVKVVFATLSVLGFFGILTFCALGKLDAANLVWCVFFAALLFCSLRP